MFNYGNANEAQREAISATDGLVLITAGPGTAIRDEVDLITKDNISSWFESNYNSLVKSEHTYLAEPQRNAALNQVIRYAERMYGKWSSIQQAEVDVLHM